MPQYISASGVYDSTHTIFISVLFFCTIRTGILSNKSIATGQATKWLVTRHSSPPFPSTPEKHPTPKPPYPSTPKQQPPNKHHQYHHETRNFRSLSVTPSRYPGLSANEFRGPCRGIYSSETQTHPRHIREHRLLRQHRAVRKHGQLQEQEDRQE